MVLERERERKRGTWEERKKKGMEREGGSQPNLVIGRNYLFSQSSQTNTFTFETVNSSTEDFFLGKFTFFLKLKVFFYQSAMRNKKRG